ncbi:MAG TPA: beta-ketoacyl-[acyl-carrier-protein] synthase II [Candidatus Omnitrophica bacterium]|nr:MAG: beta-ketoacyl-[acyl-carrier-protein] synthase II [Omnitrophica WOR_2 bacterium GWA2_45_18]HBR15435.1 beta-ketoacyl-[acyl-carrier-protein] synthase II [Candidatus Omnitrophota bacterium]
MKKRRVVVTGLGVLAANGIGKTAFWEANINGKSAIGSIEKFDTSQFRTKIAAEIRDFDPLGYMEEMIANKVDRFTQFAIACTKMALEDSCLQLTQVDPYRAGVALGSGLGGMFFYEKQILTMQQYGHSKTHPASIPRVMPNAPSANVSIEFQCKGPNLTISTACSSSNHALGQALEIIRQDKADIMLAGGTEAPLVFYNFAGFDALRVMSTEACRPFDRDRDGLVMGEGAAVLVLEELEHAVQRKAKIYAELAGYGLTSSAGHMVMPDPEGEDAAQTMALALKDACLQPSDLDYINAHGTATQANDKAETKAIKKLFGKNAYNIPISSTKSMIGHTLGATGAIEAVVCCLSIVNNLIPPTINYHVPDPECDLDYVPNQAKRHRVDAALSNAFAFGGNNAAITFKRYEG